METAYLLYVESITLQLSTDEYSTCTHAFTNLVYSYTQFPDMSRNKEVFNTKKFSVPDTLYPPNYPVDIEHFNHVRSLAYTGHLRCYKNFVAM